MANPRDYKFALVQLDRAKKSLAEAYKYIERFAPPAKASKPKKEEVIPQKTTRKYTKKVA